MTRLPNSGLKTGARSTGVTYHVTTKYEKRHVRQVKFSIKCQEQQRRPDPASAKSEEVPFKWGDSRLISVGPEVDWAVIFTDFNGVRNEFASSEQRHPLISIRRLDKSVEIAFKCPGNISLSSKL